MKLVYDIIFLDIIKSVTQVCDQVQFCKAVKTTCDIIIHGIAESNTGL